MPCVGDEREALRPKPNPRLDDHEHSGDHERTDEPSERRRVARMSVVRARVHVFARGMRLDSSAHTGFRLRTHMSIVVHA